MFDEVILLESLFSSQLSDRRAEGICNKFCEKRVRIQSATLSLCLQ
ncbi:hypothetical protein GS885_28160 [Rhodococcus hoagii]|nr:hypothetical protein [Prescottella equi]